MATTPTPVVAAETSPQPEQTPLTPREEIQKQYQEHYGAPVETPTQEPTPAPAQEPPVEAAPAEPPAPTVEELLAKVITPLVEKINALETRLTPAPTPTVAPEEKKLIDYLRSGDVDGFEAALVQRVRDKVKPEVTQDSTNEVVARVRAESEIKSFVDTVQSQNSDLAPMQGWIVAEASNLIEAAQKADKIKTLDDYVKIYKESVTKAVDTVRKAALTIRGSGKSEGMTVRKEVISTGVISPNSPNAAEEAKKQEKPTESTVDYLARRQAQHGVGRGLI